MIDENHKHATPSSARKVRNRAALSTVAVLLLSSFVGLVRTATVTFSGPVNYPVGEVPEAVAVGDFNDDGKPDLAVTNLVSNDVSLLLGNGDGTFQAAVSYGAGSGPGSIATGDFNGDGRLDLAVADFNGGTVSVLLGKGDGTFQPARIISLDASPNQIAVGDFNGDSKMDLAVGLISPNGSHVSILLGDGHGSFETPTDYSIGGDPLSLVVADLNGDNKQDLAVAATTEVGVLLGNGDGTFQQARFLPPTAGDFAFSVATGDFNLDGKLDLVVASSTTCIALLCPLDVELFVGRGDGTFQKPSAVAGLRAYRGSGFAIADFNRDGNLDTAFASRGSQGGSLTVVPGNGDGTFQPPVSLTFGLAPSSPVAADFNGDNLPDLVLADVESNDVSVLLNTTATIPTFALSLTVNGNGTGVVTIDPGSTLCAHSCTSNFASGTQITLGANADADSTFVNWSGACSGTGSCALTMNADQSVTATFNALPPVADFSMGFSPSTSATVFPGGSTSFTVGISGQNGFNSAVALACSSPVAQGVHCSLSPASVMPGGSSTLTVTTQGPSGALTPLPGTPHTPMYALWIPLPGLALVGIGSAGLRSRRRRLGFLVFGSLLIGPLFLQAACGGGNSSPRKTGGTPAGTYTVTINATSGTLQHSSTVNITVQ